MPSDHEPTIEPIVWLLAGGIVFFSLIIFACEHWYANDGALFQVFSNLLAGFSGALFMRKPKTTETGNGTSSGNGSINVTTGPILNADPLQH
jgi:hypothetical protein